MRVFLFCFVTVLSFMPERVLGSAYVAKPQESFWLMSTNTPLQCQLRHEIPRYGEGVFTVNASKYLNLDFELVMQRPMRETQKVNLMSQPPNWQPGTLATELGSLTFFQQFNGYLDQDMAWEMLSELENGYFPTFVYKKTTHSYEYVSLSSVGFQQAYVSFSKCLSQLLPYAFDDIAFSVFRYLPNSSELDSTSQDQLVKLISFLEASNNVDIIVMSSFSDDRGTKVQQQLKSEQQVLRLKAQLQALGIGSERIKTQSRGKYSIVASNETAQGRMKNKRVVVSLE